MIINNKNINLKANAFDATVNALLRLPQYKGFSRQDIVDYIDKVGTIESGGKNIYQKGTTKHGSGYYQIEDNSMDFSIKWLKQLSADSGVNIPTPSGKKAINLTKDEQMALTLAHGYGQAKAYNINMNFKDPKNTWLDTHWVGKRDATYEKKRAERSAQWDRVIDHDVIAAQKQWPISKQKTMTNAQAYESLMFNPNKVTDKNSDKYSSLIIR